MAPGSGIEWLVDGSNVEPALKRVEWGWLHERFIVPSRQGGLNRSSLDNPSQAWFDGLERTGELVVTGVVLDSYRAVADLLDFVVEPAVRLGTRLVVVADRTMEDLDGPEFVEPEFGYAEGVERLRWTIHERRFRRLEPPALPPTSFSPDATQRAAVEAGEGVVQIIAPAGSGKTTVLVERVRELLRRGTPPETIVCVTFNKAAATELDERLRTNGAQGVDAKTFHGLGGAILRAAKRKRQHTGEPTLSQWRRIAALAKRDVGRDGVWFDPGDAKAALSDIKLRLLLSPAEYTRTLDAESTGREHTLAALYERHEELQVEANRDDFDDLILRPLNLLRTDPDVRSRWQSQYENVLVDEYQDIEPAQELLVRILAAPHDQLFCVGDEDQTLYGFRRASVERIVCLDQIYPALDRIALGTNYRCPGKVVAASSRLVEKNTTRFPKVIAPAPHRADDGEIAMRPMTRVVDAASDIATTLSEKKRGDIVVLARTTNALRPVAVACAERGVRIQAPAKLFEPKGAREALRRYLFLALHPRETNGKDLHLTLRAPARPGITERAAPDLVNKLRAGGSFLDVFADVGTTRDRSGGQRLGLGDLFTQLASLSDASEAVALLRGPGGFDDWFEQADGLGGGADSGESEVLEQAEQDAKGRTVAAFLRSLKLQFDLLAAARDDEHGIELSTVHGSKGRQWPHVIVFACDEGIFPTQHALRATKADAARGEGIQAERRLGYVAFTRAQERLEIHFAKGRPSRFLKEAGILKAAGADRARLVGSGPVAPTRAPLASKRQPASSARVAAMSFEGPGRVPEPPLQRTRRLEKIGDLSVRRRRAADLVQAERLPRRYTVEDLLHLLELTPNEMAAVIGALGRQRISSKVRRLDRDTTARVASLLAGGQSGQR